MPGAPKTSPRRSGAKKRLLARKLAREKRGRTGYEIVAASLCDLGVDHVFTVPGVPMYETLALIQKSGIRVIGTRHQFTASVAASGYNFARGELSASTVVSASPAVTNLATGLLYAKENRIPLLALGGRRGASSTLDGEFQAFDAVPVLGPLTKHSGTVESVASMDQALRFAAKASTSGKPGPVYLDLHEEALGDSTSEGSGSQEPVGEMYSVCNHDIERAAELLAKAERPAMIICVEGRWNGAPQQIRTLSEKTGAACIMNPMAHGIVPSEHPQVFSRTRQRIQEEADVVLMVGEEFDWQIRYGTAIHPSCEIIMFRNNGSPALRNRTVSVLVEGAIEHELAELNRCLDLTDRGASAHWLESLRRDEQAAEYAARAEAESERNVMTTNGVLFGLRDFLQQDSVTVLDANLTMLAAQKILPCNHAGHRLTSGTNGTMGVGVPLAIGAKLALPSKQVVAVCGDFAFGLSCADFETAVRQNIPIIALVIDNGGLSGGTAQKTYFNDQDLVASYAPGTRFDRLAEALGGHGEFVEAFHELRPALDRAEETGRPTVIHVKISP